MIKRAGPDPTVVTPSRTTAVRPTTAPAKVDAVAPAAISGDLDEETTEHARVPITTPSGSNRPVASTEGKANAPGTAFSAMFAAKAGASSRSAPSSTKAPPPFLDEAAAQRQSFLSRARALGVDEKSAAALWAQSGGASATDPVTGFATNIHRAMTIQRAVEHVVPTRVPAYYVEGELTNLAGLNGKLGATGANALFADMAAAFAEGLAPAATTTTTSGQGAAAPTGDTVTASSGTTVTVSAFRNGGAVVSAVVVGAHVDEVALQRVQESFAETVAAAGMADVEHPKHKGDARYCGASFAFGFTRMQASDDVRTVTERAAADFTGRNPLVRPADDDRDPPKSRPPLVDVPRAMASAKAKAGGASSTSRSGEARAPDHAAFTGGLDEAKASFNAAALRAGASPRAAAELWTMSCAEANATDVVTGFQTGAHRVRTVERARDHVAATGDLGVYVEMDIRNLSGLNAALGRTRANEAFRFIGRAVKDELATIDATIVPFRHGGDELSFVVVSSTASPQDVRSALAAAALRVAWYVEANDLSTIEHPKHPGDAAFAGTGIAFGTAVVRAADRPEDVFRAADVEVERMKKIGVR